MQNIFLNITVHNHWSVIKVRGKGPRPRRRQCCCPINGRVFIFGGTRLVLNSNSYSMCEMGPIYNFFSLRIDRNSEKKCSVTTSAWLQRLHTKLQYFYQHLLQIICFPFLYLFWLSYILHINSVFTFIPQSKPKRKLEQQRNRTHRSVRPARSGLR